MEKRKGMAMGQGMSIQHRFDSKELTVLMCLRGCNNYIAKKRADNFIVTAISNKLRHAFALIPLAGHLDTHHIIHIESGQYLSVNTDTSLSSEWTLCVVPHQELPTFNPEALRFTVRAVPNVADPGSIHLRVKISWRNRFLALSSTETDGLLVFYSDTDPAAYALQGDNRIFTMERPKAHRADRGLKIIPLLDLVTTPRPEKCRIRSFDKVKSVSMELFKTIQAIFVRINKRKPRELKHYAPFMDVWNEVRSLSVV